MLMAIADRQPGDCEDTGDRSPIDRPGPAVRHRREQQDAQARWRQQAELPASVAITARSMSSDRATGKLAGPASLLPNEVSVSDLPSAMSHGECISPTAIVVDLMQAVISRVRLHRACLSLPPQMVDQAIDFEVVAFAQHEQLMGQTLQIVVHEFIIFRWQGCRAA